MEREVQRQIDDAVRPGAGRPDLGLLRLGARRHPDPSVRTQCLDLLDRLERRAAGRVEAVAVIAQSAEQDPDPTVRDTAASLLVAHLPHPSAARVLDRLTRAA